MRVNGDMNMRGGMNMSGRMDMDGRMDMSGDIVAKMKPDNTASRLASVQLVPSKSTTGKVAIIDVDGLLVNKNMSGIGSMGENPVALFREKLDALAADTTIRAVVLRINTPGGGVTASDIMSRDLREFKSRTGLPVVACIMDVGAGGGYYLAVSADAIVAHPTSIVGGIGVIMNTYNMEDTLGQFNILPVPIKAGKFIDIGSTERSMDKDEKAALQAIADSFHARFVSRVKESRPAAAKHAENFDGRIFSGAQAQEFALVDRVGYLDDSLEVARSLAGLHESSGVVMLRRDNDRAFTQFDVTPNTPMTSIIPIHVPGLDRSTLPTFLYLWQADSSYLSANGG